MSFEWCLNKLTLWGIVNYITDKCFEHFKHFLMCTNETFCEKIANKKILI